MHGFFSKLPIRLRSHAAPAFFGLLVGLVGLGFVGRAARARAYRLDAKRELAAAKPSPDGELALSYAAGSDATSREIAHAQAAVRAAPTADHYLELALHLVRRQRETADSGIGLYAEDALAAARARDPESPRVLAVEAMLLR